MFKVKFIITILIGCCGILGMANGKILVCDFNPMQILIPGEERFQPSDIDPTLCTHLKYPVSFEETSSGDFKMLSHDYDFDNGSNKGFISQIMDLKDVNKNLKVIAYVDNQKSTTYYNMAVNDTKRELFIEAVLSVIENHKFNGLDLNWKFGHGIDRSPQEKINFVEILSDLKETFKSRNLELSITVAASFATDAMPYDLTSVVSYVKYINVMANSYITKDKKSYKIPFRGEDERTVVSAIKYWIKQGASTSQLVLDLLFFGSYVKMSDGNQLAYSSPNMADKEIFLYSSICGNEQKLKAKWNSKFDAFYFRHVDNHFIYDDVRSIQLKVDFGNCVQLAGFHVSTIDFDDFRGKCNKEKYPLLRSVNKKLNESPDDKYCDEKGFNYTEIAC